MPASRGRRSAVRAALGLAGVGAASVIAHNAQRVLALRRDAASLRRDLDHDGIVGEGLGEPTSLWVLGDSASDGYALANHRDAFPYHVASHLSVATSRRIRVTALGHDGARILATAENQVPKISSSADAVVVLVGANDVFGRRTAAQVRADTTLLLDRLRDVVPAATVAVAGCPNFGRAPGFPQPLRTVLGWRSAVTSRAMAAVCREHGVPFVDLVAGTTPGLFGPDGVHPSRAGSLAAARGVVEALMASAAADLAGEATDGKATDDMTRG